MIQFTCRACQRSYNVPDAMAGRQAKCKCGAMLAVPKPAAPEAPPPSNPATPAKLPVRTRRLIADARQMQRTFRNSPLIRIKDVNGDPPDRYQIEYLVNGLERGKGGKPVPRNAHIVEIQLTSEYPRLGPKCRMLTPVFHPNIDPSTICVGDHWTAGEQLADLVVRIGEMLAYQDYNIKSPLDGEAAMWADLNAGTLPIDPRHLRPAEMDEEPR